MHQKAPAAVRIAAPTTMPCVRVITAISLPRRRSGTLRPSSHLYALERALYVFMRIPQRDRPAVRATGGMLRFTQFREQPVDLLGIQGHVHLNPGWAGDGRGG